ncbi:MAG: pilus assembly protein PilM [bacterium]
MPITLGIDVGHAVIKAVAVASGRTPTVLWSARVAREGAEGPALVERLAQLRAAAKGPYESVIAALGSESASLLLFPMPFSNPKIIEQTVGGEVEGLVPVAIDDQHITHQILASDKQGARIAAAVAPEGTIQATVDTLTAGGLEPRVLDLDVMALWTCAVAIAPGGGARAVVDVGAAVTRMIVLDGDRLVAVRTLPEGGQSVTAALAARVGLETDAAESRKLELSASADVVPSAEPDAEDAPAVAALREAYGAIADDIALSLRTVELKERIQIERVMLVGGAARARGFDRAVSARTGVDAALAAPPEGAAAEAGWWPDGAVAYGLALRGSRAVRGSSLNFRHGAFAYGRDVREITRRVAPLALPIAVMLLAGIVSYVVRYVSLRQQAQGVRNQVVEIFRTEFKNVPIQDPEAQTRQQIGILDKKINLLSSSAPPAEVMRALSAAAPADVDVTLDGMTMEGSRVTVEGHCSDFESIDKLKTALTGVEPFGEVRVQDQSKDGNVVRFTMILELTRGEAAGGES